MGKTQELADGLTIEVVLGDIVEFPADAVLLKYAGALHGADAVAAKALALRDLELAGDLRQPGSRRLVPKARGMAAQQVLFLSVGPLYEFRYDEIRAFARDGFAALESAPLAVRHVALTSHGANYGLDEVQAFESLVRGMFDAWKAHALPPKLERISIVEMRPRRAERFTAELPRIIEELSERKTAPEARPHVFVAMPFAEEFDDTYYYAIEPPVRDAGCLCERVDTQTFSGDILEQIRSRIATARYVIGDLSTANPNVYLEVGYAWGKGRTTVLLCRDVKELRFDVQSQRCIMYKSIRDLETKLRKELAQLDAARRPVRG